MSNWQYLRAANRNATIETSAAGCRDRSKARAETGSRGGADGALQIAEASGSKRHLSPNKTSSLSARMMETALDGILGSDAHLVLGLVSIAAAALGLLGCVFGLTGRWRYRAVQRRLVELEEARRNERARRAKQARLDAFIEQRVDVKWYLTIQNRGPAAARNLTASINGSPLDNCPLVDSRECDLAGIGAVEAHRGLRIPLQTADRPAELQLELTWSDESGQLGFYQASLPVDQSVGAESRLSPVPAQQPDRSP